MKYQTRLIRLAVSLTALTMTTATEGVAQSCSLDEVSSALNDLPCYADGTYLSGESIATTVSDTCYEEFTESACRACFNRARRKLLPVLKVLARLNVIPAEMPAEARNLFNEYEDDTCYYAGDWEYDDSFMPEDSTSKSKASATSPRARTRARGKGADARQLVEDLCPCTSPRWSETGGKEEFLGCTDTVTDILVRHEKIDDRKAKDLRSQLQRSECGR